MKWKHYLSFLAAVSLLCSLLVVSPGSAVTAADNLAANGDLELGSTSGWEIANAAIDSSVKYAGNYSLKLTSTSAYSGAAYKVVPVGKGATVSVSFYYRYGSDPGSGKTYHVYTYQGADASVGPYSDASATFSIPSGCDSISTWRQVSYTFNSGDYANIYLKFAPGGNGSSACYIDNLVVTATGGTEEQVAPYLTSFGTKYNRPSAVGYNLIKNGGFESTSDASWNVSSFIKGNLWVANDATAPEGDKSLCLDNGNTAEISRHTFPVTVEKYTQYTFSAWVKSPRLSTSNDATATFGVADADTGNYLVYDAYQGTGHGSALLSTTEMQLMATSPDGQWHLRSVTFYSGTATTVNVMVSGAESQLYLDDIALYKSAYGIEYISALRTATITAQNNTGNVYCADEASLIPVPHMTGKAAENHWSDNPAWRNGFMSFADTGDSHNYALKYTASANPLQLAYIDWIDVQPHTSYTLTMDVKRLSAGGGRIALLDDNILNPAEFYTVSFSATDSEWKTYSITFDTGVYSRIGFAIIDGGGCAYIDKTRLFATSQGVADEPADKDLPALTPVGGQTCVMEMGDEEPADVARNGGFERGTLAEYVGYQSTAVTSAAAHTGSYGAHLKGDGSWGAMLEQENIRVKDGKTYTLTYWYKANASGANITLKGTASNTQYAYAWAANTAWTKVTATFTVEGDATLLLNICGGGNGKAEDLYLDDVSLVEQDSGSPLGVAFMMELDAYGVTRNEKFVGNLNNATVDVFADGTGYRLKAMGAVITNKTSVGTDRTVFTREYEDPDRRVADVPAVYLYAVTDTSVTFAVRVVNVPTRYANAVIYARPYYVFEKDGEEVVVYGDIYSRSYNDSGEDILLD